MADILILVGIGVIWLIWKGIEGASNATSSINAKVQDKQAFKTQRSQKYENRIIDVSKGLFDRNSDIIEKFEMRVEAHPSQTHSYSRRYRSYSSTSSYHIENLTRDCINEIALAENNFSVSPGALYLSNWKSNAPKDWALLATQIEERLRTKQSWLIREETKSRELEQEIARVDDALRARIAKRKN